MDIKIVEVGTPAAGSYRARIAEKTEKPGVIVLNDRFLGAIVGNAVGDALGAPLEFNGRSECLKRFPDGIREMLAARTTGGKGPGSYTDDTEMLVAIGEAFLAADGLDLDTIGQKFVDWYNGGPPDIGGQTAKTCSAIRSGVRASEAGFQNNSQYSLGNGSVMRNGIMFVATHAAPHSQRLYAAEQVSAITHAGRDCRSSCAAMTHLQILLGEGLTSKKAIKETYDYMGSWGASPKVMEAFERTIKETYDITQVDNTGYAVGTLERAMWPLWHDLGFEEGLVACVMQGGDADSAGAVCGSLLGTYYGIQAIPQPWLDAVYANEEKHRVSKGRPDLRSLTTKVAEVSQLFYAN